MSWSAPPSRPAAIARRLRTLALVDEDVLATVPGERLRLTVLGAAVLVGTVLAMVSAVVALSARLGGFTVAFLLAALPWGVAVLNLNRAAVAAPGRRRWWRVLLRVTLSAGFGWLVAEAVFPGADGVKWALGALVLLADALPALLSLRLRPSPYDVAVARRDEEYVQAFLADIEERRHLLDRELRAARAEMKVARRVHEEALRAWQEEWDRRLHRESRIRLEGRASAEYLGAGLHEQASQRADTVAGRVTEAARRTSGSYSGGLPTETRPTSGRPTSGRPTSGAAGPHGGGERSPGDGESSAAAVEGADDRMERFLVGEAPTRVRAGDEFSLVARIVVERPDPEVRAAAMRALTVGPDGVDVLLLVHVDSGLAGTEGLQTTVRVPYRRGSEPVRFPLRALRAGPQQVRLSAWLGGTALAEVKLQVSAEENRVDETNQSRSARMDLHGHAGELTMQVGFDGARYSFQIISHRLVSEQVVARALTQEPGKAVDRTVEMLRRFATSGSGYGAANQYGPATARRWVEETGIGLWDELVPDPIKDAFWDLRDDIGTFTIACADDRVPWELLYPLADGQDHGFLTQQFPVVRRVIGELSAPRFSLGGAQFVVPPRAPSNAEAEVARLREILGFPAAGVITHVDELLRVLDDRTAAGLLHFVCHNTFAPDDGGSSITMDGGPFVPELLNRAVNQHTLRDRHPLVFVNACRSAGAAPEYTRMMSWASQFMKAGAGAFVGTLWPVNSDRAAAFAEAFYSELAAGTPLGAATMRARARTEHGGDPTWLAYSVYGDAAATAA